MNIFTSTISNEFKLLAKLLMGINLIVYAIIRVLIEISNIMPTYTRVYTEVVIIGIGIFSAASL